MAKKGRAKGANKRPAVGVALAGGKHPKAAPADDGDDRRPTWRFAKCDYRGPWPWNWDAFLEHLSTLVAIESKPWAQSLTTGTVGAVKHIRIAELPSHAQTELERLHMDDLDLHEIRLGGKPRFWGFRTGPCFNFLWYDPDHTVFPSRR